MNWFTRAIVSDKSAAHKQKLLDQDGGCEHVEKDINLAYALRAERDSFGPVSTWLCCKACEEAAEEAEGEVEEVCADCGKTHKAKDGIAWKWYDFYAAQGDEPLQICNECRKAEKHLERVRRDREDYEAEMGHYDAIDERDYEEPPVQEGYFRFTCTRCKFDSQGREVDFPDKSPEKLICIDCSSEEALGQEDQG